MYSLFGNKWLNLHGGPVWKVEGTEQDGDMATTDTKRSTNVIHFISITILELPMFFNTQARVNIPLSSRTLQQDIASSGFVVGSSVQVNCNMIFPGERFCVHPTWHYLYLMKMSTLKIPQLSQSFLIVIDQLPRFVCSIETQIPRDKCFYTAYKARDQ